MVDIFTMIISIVIMSKHPIMISDGAGPRLCRKLMNFVSFKNFNCGMSIVNCELTQHLTSP